MHSISASSKGCILGLHYESAVINHVVEPFSKKYEMENLDQYRNPKFLGNIQEEVDGLFLVKKGEYQVMEILKNLQFQLKEYLEAALGKRSIDEISYAIDSNCPNEKVIIGDLLIIEIKRNWDSLAKI
jgi:hypothetical protein